MTRRMFFPLFLGTIGALALCALGVWQVQRLAWKTDIIATIEAKLADDPVSLPAELTEAEHEYLAVEIGGALEGPELHVLTSVKNKGPGFRVIRAFKTLDNRSILVDLGFVQETDKNADRPAGAYFMSGNVLWPDETDGFTAEPNTEKNIWFARDVPKMAKALGTEPVMITVKTVTPERSETPLPVTTNIPNDHLGYAITWFSLMAIWIGMTAFLLYRIKKYDEAAYD